MKKLKIFTISLILIFLSPFFTSPAYALVLPFGGLVGFTLPCPCSGNLFIFFIELVPSPPLPPKGALVYSPYSTVLYSYYDIGKSGSWKLGDYLPGIPACWIPIHHGCITLPNSGKMGKVGTGI